MATHKSLKVTFWTRTWDLLKGIVLYGTVNWQRASDGLKPPKLSVHERKLAMPAKNLEIVKPRENPQSAIIKTQPKKVPSKKWDVTAGAIVSDPLLPEDGSAPQPFPKRHGLHVETEEMPEGMMPSEPGSVPTDLTLPSADAPAADEVVVVRRRKRHKSRGGSYRHLSRSSVKYLEPDKPGLLARWFGLR